MSLYVGPFKNPGKCMVFKDNLKDAIPTVRNGMKIKVSLTNILEITFEYDQLSSITKDIFKILFETIHNLWFFHEMLVKMGFKPQRMTILESKNIKGISGIFIYLELSSKCSQL